MTLIAHNGESKMEEADKETDCKSNAIEPIAEAKVQNMQDNSNSEEAVKEDLKTAFMGLGDATLGLVVAILQIYIAYSVGAHLSSAMYGIFTWVGLELIKIFEYKDELKLDFTKDLRAQVEEQVKALRSQVNQQLAVIFAAIAIVLRAFCGI